MDFTLQLKQITFKYTGIGGSERSVLDHTNLQFNQHECTAIIGPSGSGKTTLIQHFTGLLKPISGQVLFNGEDIWSKQFSRKELRRHIGLVFQFPETQLFEETVYKDIAFAPLKQNLPADMVEIRVREAMAAVGLDYTAFAERSPFKLSEGEKRRTAIAGVLAMNPAMVVFDEPTAGLDADGVNRFGLIVENLRQKNVAVVFITHNMDFVAQAARRVIVLKQGQIVFDGKPAELFTNHSLVEKAEVQIPHIVHYLNSGKYATFKETTTRNGRQKIWQQIEKVARNLDIQTSESGNK